MAKMMNEVTVMGRVVGEPRVNESNGRKYVNAILANERSYDSGRAEVNKIPISLSGDTAERFIKEAKPDTVIVVNGYFQSSEFTREDGSQGISYRLRGYDFYRLYLPGDAGQPLQQAIQPEFSQAPTPGGNAAPGAQATPAPSAAPTPQPEAPSQKPNAANNPYQSQVW